MAPFFDAAAQLCKVFPLFPTLCSRPSYLDGFLQFFGKLHYNYNIIKTMWLNRILYLICSPIIFVQFNKIYLVYILAELFLTVLLMKFAFNMTIKYISDIHQTKKEIPSLWVQNQKSIEKQLTSTESKRRRERVQQSVFKDLKKKKCVS